MSTKINDEFIKEFLPIFRSRKRGANQENLNKKLFLLYELVKKTPKFKQLKYIISYRDMHDILYFVVLELGKDLKDISEREFKAYIAKKLLKTKTYKFYFLVSYLFNYPVNRRLGYGVATNFDNIPQNVKEEFIQDWKHIYSVYARFERSEEEFLNKNKTATFLLIDVEASGHFKAIENATKLAEESVNVLRFLYGIDFKLFHCRFVTDNSISGGSMMSNDTFGGHASYLPKFEAKIERLSEIIVKKNPLEIEERVKNTINIFGIQTGIEDKNVKLILLISCLEGLLLSSSDKDYLGWKLAEKTSFILHKNWKKRQATSDFITNMYEKRSRFVHQDKKKRIEEVSDGEILDLENIVMGIMYELFNKLDEGYIQIQKEPSKKSINEFIEREKFR